MCSRATPFGTRNFKPRRVSEFYFSQTLYFLTFHALHNKVQKNQMKKNRTAATCFGTMKLYVILYKVNLKYYNYVLYLFCLL
jgi:hypothetical protein